MWFFPKLLPQSWKHTICSSSLFVSSATNKAQFVTIFQYWIFTGYSYQSHDKSRCILATYNPTNIQYWWLALVYKPGRHLLSSSSTKSEASLPEQTDWQLALFFFNLPCPEAIILQFAPEEITKLFCLINSPRLQVLWYFGKMRILLHTDELPGC